MDKSFGQCRFLLSQILFLFLDVNVEIQLVNALSGSVINEGIYQTNASKNGLRRGSTNTNGTAILGPFVPGEKISVQFSAQG